METSLPMQSEQRSKRKEEVNARKGGGCRASPTKGKGRWRLLHSLLTGAWCGSRHRISSPASEKVAPLPYLLSQQYRKGWGGVGCGSDISEEVSSAQRN